VQSFEQIKENDMGKPCVIRDKRNAQSFGLETGRYEAAWVDSA